MNDRRVPKTVTDIPNLGIRFGSEIAVAYQNMRVCFEEFGADGCLENLKI